MSTQIKSFVFPFVIFIISVIILLITHFDHTAALVKLSGLDSTPEKFIVKANGTSGSCHCVAFRLDDVQDFWLTNPQIAVMNVFKEKNLNLTVGIIGDKFEKDERLVFSYIKERMMNNNTNNNSNTKNNTNNKTTAAIELANHSWKHEHFSNLTIVDQSDSIRKTNEKIKNIFGITPTVFIAPFGEFNNDTLVALHENNMRYFSADFRDTPHYSIYSNATIYHLPETVETGRCKVCGDGIKNASWYGVPHEKTLYQINRNLNKYGFAVIMMHATEYSLGHDEWNFQNAVDWKQIRELELLIDKIQQEGLHIVTVGNIINHFRIS